MIGSKRVTALENEIVALRAALDGQAARAGASDARTADAKARADALTAALAEVTARIGAVEAELAHYTTIGQDVARLSETIAAEQAERHVLEQTIAKLEKRIDAQAEEVRLTATALLQRMAGQAIAQ